MKILFWGRLSLQRTFSNCAVSEYIYTSSTEGIGTPVGGGYRKGKTFKIMNEGLLEFRSNSSPNRY